MTNHKLIDVDDDGAFVVLEGGKRATLRKDQTPLTSLSDGFRPHTFFTGLSVNVFEQVHVAGHTKLEFYDKDYSFLGDKPSDLPRHIKEELQRELSQIFLRMWEVIVQSDLSSPDFEYLEFERLAIGTRVTLLSLCDAGNVPVVERQICLDSPDLSAFLASWPSENSLKFEIAKCRAIFEQNFVDISRNACTDGYLSFPSLFTEQRAISDVSLCCSEVIYWYKCFDPLSNQMFYVIATSFHCEIVAVYVPGMSLFITKSSVITDLITNMFGAPLVELLIRHLAVYAPMIRDYMNAPSRSLTLIYGQEHLGHHIWNELSGLDAFLAYPKPTPIPLVIEMSLNSEMFGKLDALFPELSGHVERITGARVSLLASIYERRLLIVRPTTLFVSSSLRRRISKLVYKQDYLASEQRRLFETKKQGSTIVCLQLRSENRTFSEPIKFFADCMSCITKTLGKACFVLDGHSTNLQTGSEIRSFKQATSSRPIMEAQFEVALALELHARTIGADFISNVGKPIGASLFWIEACDFFIAPWGAGMAKTRWAVNRPGLMLTNTWNLNNHHDIRIYDNPLLNENPRELLLASNQMIVDRPDVSVLVSGSVPFSMNFDVVFDRFRELLIEACFKFSAPS